MFSICEGMKWAHLPVAGGIYDQDPDLLDGFQIIFRERSIAEEEKERKREAESRRKGGGLSSRSGGSRRR